MSRKTVIHDDHGTLVRLDFDQVGWRGFSGRLYVLGEDPSLAEPGGFSPLWQISHSDRVDDLAPLPDLTYILAKHQLGSVLPGGVACTCGAELAALNPPLNDGAVKGEPLALAVHQFEELDGLTPQALDYLAEMSQLAQENDELRAALAAAVGGSPETPATTCEHGKTKKHDLYGGRLGVWIGSCPGPVSAGGEEKP